MLFFVFSKKWNNVFSKPKKRKSRIVGTPYLYIGEELKANSLVIVCFCGSFSLNFLAYPGG